MRMHIKSNLDPSGKQVEIYPRPSMMRTFCFKWEPNLDETVFLLTLKALNDLSTSKNKRVRDRVMPVWWGKAIVHGSEYLIVGLRYDPATEVVKIFLNHFEKHASYLEMTSSDAHSFSATPYLRYTPQL